MAKRTAPAEDVNLTLDNQEEKTEAIQPEVDNAAEQLAARDAEIAALRAQLEQMKAESAREVFVPNGRGDMERIMKLAMEISAAGGDPWTVEVRVRVPRKTGAGDDDFWVAVNGRTAQIPANGEVQAMKLPFAMALLDSLDAETKAIEFAEGLNYYNPENNPKPMEPIG